MSKIDDMNRRDLRGLWYPRQLCELSVPGARKRMMGHRPST